MAAAFLVLASQKRTDEIPHFVVSGIGKLDEAAFHTACTILLEMKDDEIVSAYICWLGLIAFLRDSAKAHFDSPEDTLLDENDENILRANENLEYMVRAALPASERLGYTLP